MSYKYTLKLDCVFPFTTLGKTWVTYIPGYEGMYCVSDDWCILSMQRTLNKPGMSIRTYHEKVLKEYRSSSDSVFYSVSKEDKAQVFTKAQLKKLVSPDTMVVDTLPFTFEGHKCVVWIPGFENIFAVSDESVVVRLDNIKKVVKSYRYPNRPRHYIFTKKDMKKTMYISQIKKLLDSQPALV